MAFGFVQGNHQGTTASSPISAPVTLTSAVTSGNTVVLAVVYLCSIVATVTVADDKGNNYTATGDNFAAGAAGLSIATFYLTNITNSPQTITATVTATGLTFAEVIADEYSGVGAGTIDGHTAQNATFTTATDNASSGTFATTKNGDLVWGVIGISASATIAHGTGFTIGQNTTNDSGTEFETQSAFSASTAATFTIGTAGNCAVGAIALAPPSGGGPGVLIAHG